jgi:transcriptional regulator with XRE-family HTH domain
MIHENKNTNEQQWKLLVFLLDEIRRQKGITQQQIADDTGLIRSNVSRFFSAKFTPDLNHFLIISKAVKVNFYFEDQESKTDLNIAMESAMETLGRRPDKLPKN